MSDYNKYQQYARSNYTVNTPIDEMWHPEIIAECERMNAEAAEAARLQAEADRSRIKDVIMSVDALEEEFKGNIVLYVSFPGTVTLESAMSKAEAEAAKNNMPDALKAAFRGRKTLFPKADPNNASEDSFPEWSEYNSLKNEFSRELKAYGIPFIADAMTVVKIAKIPDLERRMDAIEAKLREAAQKVFDAYPTRVQEAQERLGEFFRPTQYKTISQLQKSFGMKRKWMHFGVPEILKEIDMARYEAERKRTADVWAEVKQNGIVLLRKQLAGLVDTLVEAMKPNEEGKKKKFYTSSITNLTEFFDTFNDRNLAGDKELGDVVSDLKRLMSGRSVDSFKNDEALRERIASSGASISKQINSMLVDASARVIELE